MKEAHGNLWEYPADIRIITTNGTVKRNGAAVMGRGCAQEARDRVTGLDRLLGTLLNDVGNHVHALTFGLMSFPVKHNWWEKADPELIERSAHEAVVMADRFTSTYPFTFVMPRPGCGNGGLTWNAVKPIIEPILDDRFTVITF